MCQTCLTEPPTDSQEVSLGRSCIILPPGPYVPSHGGFQQKDGVEVWALAARMIARAAAEMQQHQEREGLELASANKRYHEPTFLSFFIFNLCKGKIRHSSLNKKLKILVR